MQREAGLGELARGRLGYRSAAEHFHAAADLLSGDDEHASIRLDYVDRAADALYKQGDELGDNDALREAVAAYKAALEERTRERVPLQWAMTQSNLGHALQRLGARETGTQRSEQAVEAHRAALQEQTHVPLQWATTQNRLGLALRTLGERESGTQRLQEAVEAFRSALQERTRQRVPLGWAITQSNLGNALRALGERETGTQRLEEAVAAYEGALAVFAAAQASYYVSVVRDNLECARAGAATRLAEGDRRVIRALAGPVTGPAFNHRRQR